MALTGIQIVGDVQNFEKYQSDFNLYGNFIGNLYFSALPKISIPHLKKIVIVLLEDDSFIENIIPYSKDFPISTVQHSFNFPSFIQKDDFNKRKDLFEFLHQRILKLSKEFNWDSTPFISAYEKIKNKDYESKTIVGKLKSSKDRKHKAGIGIEQDVYSASIYILFFDSNENLLEKLKIFETLPQPYLYAQVIGKSKWLNNSDFVLHNKSEEIRIVASLPDSNLSIMYIPKGRDVYGVKEELKFIAKDNILPSWFG
jgi:hypothetical protein